MRARVAGLLILFVSAFAAPAAGAPGDLDGGFGAGGVFMLPAPTGNANFNQIALAPGGKLLVAGFAQQSGAGKDVVVARLTPGGQLDPSFNPAGPTPGVNIFPFTPGAGDDVATAIALDADGNAYVAGTTDPA